MPIQVIPRYIFVVDWNNTRAELPYDHANAIVPTQFDLEHGLDLFDIHSMRGLRGSFTVNDNEGTYDPTKFPEGIERERLEQPHRFYHYRLDSEPLDTSLRHTGWVIVDRRPDKNTARFRLLPLDFVRLREDTATVSYTHLTLPTIYSV